jgi:hypothetical protein
MHTERHDTHAFVQRNCASKGGRDVRLAVWRGGQVQEGRLAWRVVRRTKGKRRSTGQKSTDCACPACAGRSSGCRLPQ